MTILQFPIEIQDEVYAITGVPPIDDPINITVKFKKTLSDEILQRLKQLGVKFMTPVKLNEESSTSGTSA